MCCAAERHYHWGFVWEALGAADSCHKSSCPGGGSSLVKPTVGNSIVKDTKPEILLNICELLCSCVVYHPYRIKNVCVFTSHLPFNLLKATTSLIMMSCTSLLCCRCNFLLSNSLDKVLFLTRRREKYLVVAAVRFVHTLILVMWLLFILCFSRYKYVHCGNTGFYHQTSALVSRTHSSAIAKQPHGFSLLFFFVVIKRGKQPALWSASFVPGLIGGFCFYFLILGFCSVGESFARSMILPGLV